MLNNNFTNLKYISSEMRVVQLIPRSLTARIPGSHPGGPGSTPGVGRIHIFALYERTARFLRLTILHDRIVLEFTDLA